MKAYLAAKYHSDNRNKKHIEDISRALSKLGIETVVMARDHEKWGKSKFASPNELMTAAFKAIDECDLFIADVTEKGVGVGIEAGYAHAKGKPIHLIAMKGVEISETLMGIAKSMNVYEYPEEINIMM